MEAFEHVVRVFLEGRGYVVSTNVKLPVRKRTKKLSREEYQTHGYEVDIVGARGDELLLGSVKSYLGSKGVSRQGFVGIADKGRKADFDGYKMFNDEELRDALIRQAAERYGYRPRQVHLALFVGKFRNGDEDDVRRHLTATGCRVYGNNEITAGLLSQVESKTYVDDPVVMALKSLKHAGHITP